MNHNDAAAVRSDRDYWRKLKILAERASRDTLSGLLNRETATAYIEDCLKARSPDETCALFIIDLDNFKQVNDSFGHQAGDRLIQQAASILSRCFRATDIVGRLGGDEFFALLSGKVTKKIVREKAQKICEQLQFSIGSPAEVRVTSSVGAYLAFGAVSFETLYARADSALYEAKANGKNGFQINAGGEGRTVTKRAEKNVMPFPIHIHSLLTHLDEGISLYEVADTIRLLYGSPAFCKMMNIEGGHETFPCELSVLDKIHPDDMEEYENLLREGVRSGMLLECEYRFAPNEGDWHWCRAKAVRIPAPEGTPSTMLVLSSDVSAIKNTENSSFEDQERLKLALGQRSQFLWEVDISTKTFRLSNFRRRPYVPGIHMENFPDSLIAKGWVHPVSAARFKEFGDKLLGGNAAGGGVFALRHKMSKKYGWFSVFYRALSDKDGSAVKVIGSVEALSEMGVQESFVGKEHLWKALRPNLLFYLQANLSTDRVESLWRDGREIRGNSEYMAYQTLIERNRSKLFFKEEMNEFVQVFSRSALLDAFHNGHTWLTKEFRRVDECGNINWFSHTAVLSMAPQTQHIHVFFFVQNVERRRTREKAWEDVEYAAATELYGRKSAQALAEHVVQTKKSSLQALALVRIIGDSVFLSGRGKTKQQKGPLIARAFSLLLGSDCILGERGEDKITIFWPEAVPRAQMRQRIDETFAFVRNALPDAATSNSLRFVAAVICEKLYGADYGEILSKAESICDTWKNVPEDSVIFFNKKEDRRPEEYCDVPKKNEALLTGQGKDIVFACLDAMFMANSVDAAMSTALAQIGCYYGADRVYTLALTESGESVAVVHEWVSHEKASIRRFTSGTRLERLPLLRSCLEKGKPVVISRMMQPSTRKAKGRMWNYGVFPLNSKSDDKLKGFLCVENPRCTHDITDLERLLPYIVHIHRFYSFAVEGEDTALLDALTGLSNLQAYRSTVYLLSSDKYSSMGVLSLDIPQIASGMNQAGSDVYAKMLLHVSEVLTAIFGRSFVFRTRNAEFVAFCPNTTQDVFLARILRTQSMLQRRHPKALRFGHTWASGIFSGETLLKEARIIMRCGDATAPAFESSRLDTTAGMDWQKHFTVYLQPKVDMQTGRAIGAEALVRGIGDAGRIVSPVKFIDAMEKAGIIRELDFFMLCQSLALMEGWRLQGLKLIPVSVNFSRLTLFSPSAPGSVLAILSRYPSISPDLIELELTETASNVENNTLERIMDSFRAFGVRFALDDFGSQFANLSLFTNIRFDTVKLDRSLIRELSYNTMCRSLVGDIVRICKCQSIQCVAEGVETQGQVDALLADGCTCAQGFYYDRPIPAQDFKQKYLE